MPELSKIPKSIPVQTRVELLYLVETLLAEAEAQDASIDRGLADALQERLDQIGEPGVNGEFLLLQTERDTALALLDSLMSGTSGVGAEGVTTTGAL